MKNINLFSQGIENGSHQLGVLALLDVKWYTTTGLF
jgi:hypothetical protein